MWFIMNLQELLALVYESILSVSAKLDLENVPPQKPDFHIKRSMSLSLNIELMLFFDYR